jgi:hypothetical protein
MGKRVGFFWIQAQMNMGINQSWHHKRTGKIFGRLIADAIIAGCALQGPIG